MLNRDSRSHRHWCQWALAIAVSCWTLGGCTGADGPVLHRVSGILNLAGRPVPHVMVHFEPVAAGHPSTGKSNAEGRFTLRYNPDREGVLAGDYKVWIEYIPKTPQEEMQLRAGKLPLAKELQDVLKKYGSAKISPLQQTVQKAETSLVLNLD